MESVFYMHLQESGIPMGHLAYAVGLKSETSIRRYAEGFAVPRIEAALLLRAAVGMPVEKWVDPPTEAPYRPNLPAVDPTRGLGHLKSHLKHYRVPQIELSYKTHSTPRNVSLWLNRRSRPSVEKAVLLQHHFSIPVSIWYQLTESDLFRIEDVRHAAGLTGATALEADQCGI